MCLYLKRKECIHVSEEVGHIFCARDYTLRLNGNNCVFYVPKSIIMAWDRGKSKLPTRSEAAVGEFER